MRFVFGAYEPDKPDFLSDTLRTATNVYPATIGYRPVGQFSSASPAMPAKALGAASFVASDGTSSIIAGTSTDLYQLTSFGWTSIGSSYTMASNDRWRFAQFGGVAIATNGVDPMVKIDLTSMVTSALGGTPPKTKLLAVVKDFLVGGVIDDQVNMVQWSGINNAEYWTIGSEQSDYQILPSGGEVTGILGGEFGVILQRSRVSRMTYVGDNLVFQFDEISSNIGCVSRHSVVQSGQMGFWLSDSGFVMWDGATIKPIGQERIDRTFAESYSNADWSKMSAAVDLRNSLVAWSMTDRIFVYNWVLDRWSVIEQAADIVFSGFTRTKSLEDLDAMFGSLELVSASLDSDIWKGGNPRLFVIDATNTLGTFGGQPMVATIETRDMELTTNREARITSVHPLGDAIGGITLSISSRARLGDPLTPHSYSGLVSSGDIPVRECGRYARFNLSIAAGTTWEYMNGLDVKLASGARR